MSCAFCCSAVDRTDEHIYAKWMRNGLQALARTTVSIGADPRPIRIDTGPTIVLKKGVCGACNSGWMSTLERRVQNWLLPAIQGQTMAYAPETARAIAAWSAEKALLLQLKMAQMGRPSFAPESCLEWLYLNRASPMPPPGIQVWLGCVDAQLGTNEALTGSLTTGQMAGASGDPQFYFVTFSVGCLVMQVAGQDFRTGREHEYTTPGGAPLATFVRPDSLLSSLVSIWPEQPDLVTWPPSHALTEAELTQLGEWQGSGVLRPEG